jgi:hypothetical protein
VAGVVEAVPCEGRSRPSASNRRKHGQHYETNYEGLGLSRAINLWVFWTPRGQGFTFSAEQVKAAYLSVEAE